MGHSGHSAILRRNTAAPQERPGVHESPKGDIQDLILRCCAAVGQALILDVSFKLLICLRHRSVFVALLYCPSNMAPKRRTLVSPCPENAFEVRPRLCRAELSRHAM